MNKISLYRNKTGLSQVKLARVLGWTAGRLANYETFQRTPSLADSRKIVSALNQLGVKCSLDEVFPCENEHVFNARGL